MKFEKVKLKDFAKVNMGQSPKSEFYNIKGNGLPFLQGVRTFGTMYPEIDTFTTKAHKTAEKGDILFTVRAPVGDVNISPTKVCIGRGLASISSENNIFLYYLLKNSRKKFNNVSTGTIYSSINKKELEDLDFDLPLKQDRIKISRILFSLDKKIEVNNKIIENLEVQAQAIFKSWFVDFEPFADGDFVESDLGLIPKGWEVVELLDIADFIGGSQPPKSEHIYEPQDGYVRFVQNRDYDGNESHLTYIKESKRNKLANKKDILMDKYGEAGKVRYGIAGAYNVALAKIEPFNPNYLEYIRRFLEQENIRNYIYNASIASTRPSVSKATLINLKLVLPKCDWMKKYNQLSDIIIDKTLSLQEQNQKLASIRDTLLPKLMAGEIDIANISIED